MISLTPYIPVIREGRGRRCMIGVSPDIFPAPLPLGLGLLSSRQKFVPSARVQGVRRIGKAVAKRLDNTVSAVDTRVQ